MAIETLKENICVNQIIGKLKENIVAEGDIIIPDIKPDILSTINTNGTICIYKKEILDGKIRIDGGVQVYVMYLADDENGSVRGINTVLDFTKIIEMKNVNTGMNLESNIDLVNIDCKILNGRKVNIKANMDMEVSIFSNDNIEFIKDINNNDEIQVLNNFSVMDSLVGTGTTKVYAKDTIKINENDNLAEIMSVDFSIINKEIKTSYNKILAKSDMKVNLLYLTDDNRVNEAKWSIPVMGFIDMQGISDDNLCDLNYEVKNCLIKPNNVDEHSVYVEVELEIYGSVFEKKEFNVIQDLYSPTENLIISQKNIIVMQDKKNLSSSYFVKEKISVSNIQNSKICSMNINPKILKQNNYNDKIGIDGELEVKVMYISSVTNRLEVNIQAVPFNMMIDCTGVEANSNLSNSIEIGNTGYEISADGSIDISVDLNIITNVYKMMEVSVIDNIEVSEDNDENVYSIVVYFVKPGDTLWKIAKKFKSTIKAIASVNGIEDENKINIGQQLFIPKFV